MRHRRHADPGGGRHVHDLDAARTVHIRLPVVGGARAAPWSVSPYPERKTFCIVLAIKVRRNHVRLFLPALFSSP
ncbi:hypothetical protein GCM10022384_57180 [Streptomyces marokkonensis]|uniref:Uncharacterized protein n=1 Tax=Streptomyces marokkonensis TaxID=324855 RepID=A0ABP7RVZ8_9ACTN